MPNYTLTTVEGSGSDNIRIGQVVEMAQGPVLINSTDGLQSYLKEGNYVESGYATELEQFTGVPTSTGGSTIEGLGVRGYLIKLSNNDEIFIQNAAVSYLSVGGTGPWVQRADSIVSGVASMTAPLEQWHCKKAVVTPSGNIYAIFGTNLLVSIDLGLTWASAGLPVSDGTLTDLIVADDGAVLVSGLTSGSLALLRRISSSGVHTEPGGYGSTGNGQMLGLLKTSNGSLYVANNASNGVQGIYRSTDNGVSWAPVVAGVTCLSGATNGTEVIYATSTLGTLRYMNSGGTWSGITPSGFPAVNATYLAFSNGKFYAGSNVGGYKGKLFTAATANGSWSQVSLPSGKLYGTLIPAGELATKVVFTSATGKPFVTSDGVTFTYIDTVGKGFVSFSVAAGGSSLIITLDTTATTDNIATSKDGGKTWVTRSTGFVVNNGIFYAGDNTFVMCHNNGMTTGNIYTTFNGGETWVTGSRSSFDPTVLNTGASGFSKIASGGGTLISVGTGNSSNWFNSSQDGGASWGSTSGPVSTTYTSVTYFKGAGKFVIGSQGNAGTYLLFRTEPDLGSFTQIHVPINETILAVASSDDYLVATTTNRIHVYDTAFKLIRSVKAPAGLISSSIHMLRHVVDDTWVYSNGSMLGITYDNFETTRTVENQTVYNTGAFFGTYSGNYVAAGCKNKGKAYGIPKRTSGTTKYLRIK